MFVVAGFVTSVVFVALVCEGTDSLREELVVIINHRREREREEKRVLGF